VTILFCRCELVRPLSIDPNVKRTHVSEAEIEPHLKPSFLVAKNLNQSYPITLLSKLFSSVPKREYAIRDISLQFGSLCSNDSDENSGDGVTVLVGRSGSGKSTLLRLLSGSETPHSGKVMLNGQDLYSSIPNSSHANSCSLNLALSRPVILDRKPDCYQESASVLDSVIQIGITTSPNSFQMEDKTKNIVRSLALYLLQLLEMSEDQLHVSPSQLIPSDQYLYGIACACMKSMCTHTFSYDSGGDINGIIPYPILLLDELLDKEHNTVSSKVGRGLWKLTESGGIVIVATHRPDHWKDVPGREVTLNSGRILIERRRKVKY